MYHVIHHVAREDAEGHIEVYGDPEDSVYEWRIVTSEGVLEDTGHTETCYANAAAALRDALNHDASPVNIPCFYRLDADAGRDNDTQSDQLQMAIGDMAHILLVCKNTAEHFRDTVGGDARAEAYYKDRIPCLEKFEDVLRRSMDWLDGCTPIPEGGSLPGDFIEAVSLWHHKGNLWGGVEIVANRLGHFEVRVLNYLNLTTWISGGVFDSRAEACAAIGAALDETHRTADQAAL